MTPRDAAMLPAACLSLHRGGMGARTLVGFDGTEVQEGGGAPDPGAVHIHVGRRRALSLEVRSPSVQQTHRSPVMLYLPGARSTGLPSLKQA